MQQHRQGRVRGLACRSVPDHRPGLRWPSEQERAGKGQQIVQPTDSGEGTQPDLVNILGLVGRHQLLRIRQSTTKTVILILCMVHTFITKCSKKNDHSALLAHNYDC